MQNIVTPHNILINTSVLFSPIRAGWVQLNRSEPDDELGANFVAASIGDRHPIVIKVFLIIEADIAMHILINITESAAEGDTIACSLIGFKLSIGIAHSGAMCRHSVKPTLHRCLIEHTDTHRHTIVGIKIVCVG